MTEKELLNRIENKKAMIVKIEKRVAKWSKGMSADDIDFIKSTVGKKMTADEKARYYSIADGYELRCALSDLRENNITLDKYNNQLNVIMSKEQATKIQVVVDFINQWATEYKKACMENAKYIPELYEVKHHLTHLQLVMYRRYLTDQEHEKYMELKHRGAELQEMIPQLALSSYTGNSIDEARLNKLLEEEKEARYWNLIERVTKVTGEITEAKALNIGIDGNINGVIIGEKGKANVRTIGAGGYNIQRYHYRVLVNKC